MLLLHLVHAFPEINVLENSVLNRLETAVTKTEFWSILIDCITDG